MKFKDFKDLNLEEQEHYILLAIEHCGERVTNDHTRDELIELGMDIEEGDNL